MSLQNKSISTVSDEVSLMSEEWPMLSALMAGTGAMRKAGKLLLPQWPSESDADYKLRLNVSVLHPAFSRTVNVMASKPFVQESVIEPDLPQSLSVLKSDCDLEGTDFDEFLADRFVDCLSHGIVGVLVDYTQSAQNDGKPRSIAENRALNARPYLSVYKWQSFIGWRLKDKKLDALRLMESVTESDGEYNVKTVQQVRLLKIGKWTTYRKNDKDEWAEYQSGICSDSAGNPLKVIPFRFFYGAKKGFGVGQSPLIGLAYQNVEHWQSSSDQQNILHVARVPILFAKGFDAEEKITVSANAAITSTSVDADVKWVEHTGAAIGAGSSAIEALEERMRQSGAELLVKKEIAATATEVRGDKDANKSVLENIVEEFEDGAEELIKFACLFTGDNYEPVVKLYKDFGIDASTSDMDTIFRAKELEIIDSNQVKTELLRRGIIAI